MNERQQMLAIVDRLTGRAKIVFPSHAFQMPWRVIYAAVRPATSLAEARVRLTQAAAGLEDAPRLVSRLLALAPDDAFRPDPSLQDLAPTLRAPRWLWPGWIPRGLLTVLGAAPGAGKSLLALDLAGRLISRDPFPDGALLAGGPSRPRVLVADADANPTLLTGRAQAWGFDLGRLFLFQPEPPAFVIDLTQDGQRRCLLDQCLRLRPFLVIVDALGSACPGAENKLNHLLEVLRFFEALAAQIDAALLLIHHLRKRDGAAPATVTASDLRGHSYLVAAARSILGLSLLSAPQGQTLRRLHVVKTNLCAPPPPLRVDLTTAPRLRYACLPHAPTGLPEPSLIELCADWLLALLRETGEPLPPREIIALARHNGFSESTVYRARRRLGAAITDLGASLRDPNKLWTLPGN